MGSAPLSAEAVRPSVWSSAGRGIYIVKKEYSSVKKLEVRNAPDLRGSQFGRVLILEGPDFEGS